MQQDYTFSQMVSWTSKHTHYLTLLPWPYLVHHSQEKLEGNNASFV